MHQNSTLLEAASSSLQYTGISLQNPHPFSIEKSKCYAIIGENGCGKTTLGKIIEKGWNIGTNVIHGDKKSLQIRNIEFSDIHSLTGCKDSYYQQRFEATQNDAIPTVEELIKGRIEPDLWNKLCDKLSLTEILHKRINFLSSGELRKFLIINLFSSVPDILIIDNPYIGLDATSRELFNNLIKSIVSQDTAVILLLCNPIEIPDFCTHIIPMKNREIGKMREVKDVDAERKWCTDLFPNDFDTSKIPFNNNIPKNEFSTAFELRKCNVNYGATTILNEVSWKVQADEKWALLGENGAGKSTLLSLVYADNPQGYRNDIILFDHQRGTGESIWEIKRNISYISPEMHLYFNNGEDVMTIVASGFHDNVGCFRKITPENKEIAIQWLEALGIANLADRRFNTLSAGEQRLALLARTFIKGAPLLILDEPLHGLDMSKKKLIAKIIEKSTDNENVALIYVTHYEHEIPSVVNHTFRLTKFRNTALNNHVD